MRYVACAFGLLAFSGLAFCQTFAAVTGEVTDTTGAVMPNVTVTATTTQPIMPATSLSGADAYMDGLEKFATPIIPGSLQVSASVGDDRNALLMLTVQGAFGPGGAPVPLPGARLYLFDDDGKIKSEQVVFYVGGPA